MHDPKMTADTAPAWPDPERPGVPLNPETDGWHVVAMTYTALKKVTVERHFFWSAEKAQWWLPSGALDWIKMPPSFFGRHGYAPAYPPCYLGPCLTPSEVTAREAAGWAAGAAAMREAVAGEDGAEAFLRGFYGSKAGFSESIRDGLLAVRALPIPPMPNDTNKRNP